MPVRKLSGSDATPWLAEAARPGLDEHGQVARLSPMGVHGLYISSSDVRRSVPPGLVDAAVVQHLPRERGSAPALRALA
jgi:hypothetical protein